MATELFNVKELWKDIKGYEYKYQISNYGRVRIKENITKRLNMGEVRDYLQKSIIMKPTGNGHGYLKVRLVGKDKIIKNHYIHRLVAIHFLKSIEGKNQVNHVDGNKSNNTLNNLEWCTPSENINHAIENSLLIANTTGIHSPSPVIQLDASTGIIINEYDSIKEAQNATGVSHISCVCRGMRTSAGGFHWKYK